MPGPYGLAAHVEDLSSIASIFAAAPLLVGHSMGAFVSALAVATHPERFSGAVLVDGGLAIPAPADLDIDAALTAVIGPAMDRLAMRFDGVEDYLAFWDAHPSLGPALRGAGGEAVRRYIIHDLVPNARLGFATAFTSEVSFADNIRALRFTAGCDIIVDDVIYYHESPFQDGLPAQAVNAVTADGARFLGLAQVAGNIWLAIMAPLFAVGVLTLAILPEERHLEARFGEAYREYKARTRRWF